MNIRKILANVALAMTLVVGTANAQTPFDTDRNDAIQDGLDWFDANNVYNNPSSAGNAAGLAALALLEKRLSADPLSAPQGYANANAADQARLDNIIAFIINSHTGQASYTYRDGADLMALSVYLRTAGPNQAGALNSINVIFDRLVATQDGLGYWCYGANTCQDSSTTQFAMAGLSATRSVYSDPAYADAGRLATLNASAAAGGAAYVTNMTVGGAGGNLGGGEGGHGYRRGNVPSAQQTASGTWIQLVGGADLNAPGVQAYLRWLYNRYRHTNINTGGIDAGWGATDHYYLWSSFKAYEFIHGSAVVPNAGNISPDDFGLLPPANAPAFGLRQVNRDPLTDVRPPTRGAGGAGYYGVEQPGVTYDYHYDLLTRQAANGYFNAPGGRWNVYSNHAYALLVLERSTGGGCIDTDGDGICDADDNCPANANPGQEDGNGDGVGDVCQVACDVDLDGDVDRLDISAVLLARNTAITPVDPRDPDGNGIVNVVDARQCVLLCTLPRCASPP